MDIDLVKCLMCTKVYENMWFVQWSFEDGYHSSWRCMVAKLIFMMQLFKEHFVLTSRIISIFIVGKRGGVEKSDNPTADLLSTIKQKKRKVLFHHDSVPSQNLFPHFGQNSKSSGVLNP